ncbi:MAG TPA: ParB/RepB/Spo0J family partition protein [Anaerolineales bacterium]|nr:ParB/RepB/Spo0J family partition protein [Anaerolineales bacterium]
MNITQRIPIEKIVRGKNPRTHFDTEKLQELAMSIKERGLIQPIIVEPRRGGTFLLVAGERRLRAHELLRRRVIKAIVRGRTNHNGRERLLDAVIENDQRDDMDPIDRANAYRVLRDVHKLTTRQIAHKVGKGTVVVENHLLLVRLDPEIQEMIRQGFWTDQRLIRGLLRIPDRTIRVGLAERLYKERVNLKGCWAAVEATIEAIQAPPLRRSGRPKLCDEQPYYARQTVIEAGLVPSMEIAGATVKPLRWDALRQLGQVPEWELVVDAAGNTCQACPLRDIASPMNCEGCAAVTLLQRLVEVAK